MPASAARCIAKLPLAFGSLSWLLRVGTALKARALAVGRLQELQEMTAAADRIVVVCQWLHDALIANGVPSEQLVLIWPGRCRCGSRKAKKGRRYFECGSRRVSRTMGSESKGCTYFVEAFKRLPKSLPIALDICAAAQGRAGEEYRASVQRSALGEAHPVLPSIPHQEIFAFLAALDVIAVPSQWLETGPLVVLNCLRLGRRLSAPISEA